MPIKLLVDWKLGPNSGFITGSLNKYNPQLKGLALSDESLRP